MRLVAAVMVLGACVEWTAPQMQQQLVPSTVIERREQGCRKIERVRERRSLVEDKQLTRLGKVFMLAGTVFTLIGVRFVTEGDHQTQAGGVQPARTKGGVAFIAWGVALLGGPLLNRYATGPSRRGTVVIDKELPSSEVDVPCENAP